MLSADDFLGKLVEGRAYSLRARSRLRVDGVGRHKSKCRLEEIPSAIPAVTEDVSTESSQRVSDGRYCLREQIWHRQEYLGAEAEGGNTETFFHAGNDLARVQIDGVEICSVEVVAEAADVASISDDNFPSLS